MLAVVGGTLALLLGVLLLLLPLLVSELSRPRDSVWGAVVLVLGLVLVTGADRLSGAPMLGVLCGGLLIGRLGLEVGQGRWRALSEEERLQLASRERWQRSLEQVLASASALLQGLRQRGAVLLEVWGQRGRPTSSGKRWIRPETEAAPAAEAPAAAEGGTTAGDGAADPPQPDPGPTSESPMAEDPVAEDSAAPDLSDPVAPAEGLTPEGTTTETPGADLVEPAVLETDPAPPDPGVVEVADFGVIDRLLEQVASRSAADVPQPVNGPQAAGGDAAGEAG